MQAMVLCSLPAFRTAAARALLARAGGARSKMTEQESALLQQRAQARARVEITAARIDAARARDRLAAAAAAKAAAPAEARRLRRERETRERQQRRQQSFSAFTTLPPLESKLPRSYARSGGESLAAAIAEAERQVSASSAAPTATAATTSTTATTSGSASAAVGTSTEEAITEAKRQTMTMLADPGYSELEKLVLSARILAAEGHGDTLAGQLTRRDTIDGELAMWTTRYGVLLDEVTADDFVLIDSDLKVRDGEGFPNKATRFHLHVYRQRPDINAIVHTHPPATAALSMVGLPLEIEHMDGMALYGDVQHLKEWPGVPFGDEEGELISGVLAPDHKAALLAHHGLITCGGSIEEATYRAWFFERAARMQLDAVAMTGGGLEHVRHDVATAARDWRASAGPVNAHFNAWARKALRDPANRTLAGVIKSRA